MAVTGRLNRRRLEALLARLDPDRDGAGRQYERLRRRAAASFAARGAPNVDELTDEVIDRVARRLEEGEDIRDPMRYALGVAAHVWLEHLRAARAAWPVPGTQTPSPEADAEQRDRCLSLCLGKADPAARRLVLAYYEGQGGERIARRERLARELGTSLNGLRIRVHRIREGLRACVQACLEDE